ncbi:MAG: hypothetical protein QME32_04015 [Endomicrobiia bacterium]|nr:hypothetical protein [Endomicrobiia bacterium]
MAEDFSKIIETFKIEVDALTSDVSRAAVTLRELKKEKAALMAELDFLRVENQNARLIISKNDKLTKDKIWALNHLEKILKKLHTLHV